MREHKGIISYGLLLGVAVDFVLETTEVKLKISLTGHKSTREMLL